MTNQERITSNNDLIDEAISKANSLPDAGELGWWGDMLYMSKVDNNVYTPVQYADNWEIVE